MTTAAEPVRADFERREPRCRICRDETVRILVNDLLDWRSVRIILGMSDGLNRPVAVGLIGRFLDKRSGANAGSGGGEVARNLGIGSNQCARAAADVCGDNLGLRLAVGQLGGRAAGSGVGDR